MLHTHLLALLDKCGVTSCEPGSAWVRMSAKYWNTYRRASGVFQGSCRVDRVFLSSLFLLRLFPIRVEHNSANGFPVSCLTDFLVE